MKSIFDSAEIIEQAMKDGINLSAYEQTITDIKNMEIIELIIQLETLKVSLDKDCAFCNERTYCNPKYVTIDGYRTMLQGIKPDSFIFVINEVIKFLKKGVTDCTILIEERKDES